MLFRIHPTYKKIVVLYFIMIVRDNISIVVKIRQPQFLLPLRT